MWALFSYVQKISFLGYIQLQIILSKLDGFAIFLSSIALIQLAHLVSWCICSFPLDIFVPLLSIFFCFILDWYYLWLFTNADNFYSMFLVILYMNSIIHYAYLFIHFDAKLAICYIRIMLYQALKLVWLQNPLCLCFYLIYLICTYLFISKFSLGDLEHTHLVKGLDYALLHKVRSEIDKKTDGEDGKDEQSRYVIWWILNK